MLLRMRHFEMHSIQRAIEEDLIRNERHISMVAPVLKERNITDSELQNLVNKRLLRKDMRLGGVYYEVSHDTLVRPILKNYDARKVKEFRNKILAGRHWFIVFRDSLFRDHMGIESEKYSIRS